MLHHFAIWQQKITHAHKSAFCHYVQPNTFWTGYVDSVADEVSNLSLHNNFNWHILCKTDQWK
jgi:hypothetical protein